MESLNIEATADTPAIDFRAEDGRLSVAGKSYPQNVFQFYKPISDWLNQFLQSSQVPAELHLSYIALNSSTTKVIFDWLDSLEQAQEENPERGVKVVWHYPPERSALLQAGEDFREAFEELSFELVPDLK
ncbi:MAG: DUF1987 domain-containing protein [bacterium]|nr:DUF1987 domain-containing protein [bacterium]